MTIIFKGDIQCKIKNIKFCVFNNKISLKVECRERFFHLILPTITARTKKNRAQLTRVMGGCTCANIRCENEREIERWKKKNVRKTFFSLSPLNSNRINIDTLVFGL